MTALERGAGRGPGGLSGVIDPAAMLPDTATDFIGDKLTRFRSIATFSAAKKQLRHDLAVMSPYFGYKGWWADPRDYRLHRVGESFLYEVPVGKRGRLAQFQGKRVRLFCLWSGAFRRFILVGPVSPLDVE